MRKRFKNFMFFWPRISYIHLKKTNLLHNLSSVYFADIAGGKKAEGVWEHGVEENIWTYEGRGNGGMEETA